MNARGSGVYPDRTFYDGAFALIIGVDGHEHLKLVAADPTDETPLAA